MTSSHPPCSGGNDSGRDLTKSGREVGYQDFLSYMQGSLAIFVDQQGKRPWPREIGKTTKIFDMGIVKRRTEEEAVIGVIRAHKGEDPPSCHRYSIPSTPNEHKKRTTILSILVVYAKEKKKRNWPNSLKTPGKRSPWLILIRNGE